MKQAAERRGLRVLTPQRLAPFVAEARAIGADAFVVASYGKIVPQALLDLVPVAFNVHPSLLPLYRGATPLQSAIRDGRAETAVTIIAMNAGMDTGDVLLQERVRIRDDETYGELHDETALIGARLAAGAIDRYENGTLARTPQATLARELGIEESEIQNTLTRPLRKDDLTIEGELTAKQIVDVIRSLAPNPAARTRDGFLTYGPAKVLKAHVARDGPEIPHAMRVAGRVVALDGRTWIESTDGLVAIDELVVPGSKPMTAEQFRNGNRNLSGPAALLPVLQRQREVKA
ncbi:MAG: methionyl-tRNA formyltransferase [Candidatus Elarobacter sp.]